MIDPIAKMNSWLDGEPVPTHDEIIATWGRAFLMYRHAWDMGEDFHPPIDESVALSKQRHQFIKQFGFAIPCRELLDVLAQAQPIVEIGAGSGYLTALMRKNDIDVVGTDISENHYGFQRGRYDPDQVLLPGKTAVRRYRDRTVFCSWPTLDHTWFRQALRAMRIGQRLIVIEEDACAEETTWDYRDRSFQHLASIALPAWHHLNDRAGLWVKKRHFKMRTRTLEETQEERAAAFERLKNWAREAAE